MNRLIKFRAWHKKDKIMLDWLCIRQTVFNTGDWQLMYDIFASPSLADDYGFLSMQYTGLNDKNGKEIYEGDILYCHEYDSSDTEHRITQTFKNAVVGYSQGCFWYHPNGNMNQPHQLLMYAYKPKIIGNIYQDPEILQLK